MEKKALEKVEEIPVQKPPLPVLEEAPAADDPNSCELVFKLPGSGERISRRFLKTDTAQKLYSYIDYLYIKGDCSFELESQSNMGGKS